MSNLKKEDLKLKEENKDDFKESIIQRSNLTNEFKISDIDRHLVNLNKMKREVDGTVSLAEKMVENIEKNHKELIDSLTDEQKSHVWLWQENRNIIGEGAPKQKEIDGEIEKHEGYLETIYDAFGFVKTEPTMKVEEGFVPKPKKNGKSKKG